MYSLRLTCSPEEIDELSAELWDAGTVGVEEIDAAEHAHLIGVFELRDESLLRRFGRYSPEWNVVPELDWVEESYRAWPPREIGRRLFVAPPWCTEPTPPGRMRIVHNPGQASGTGEHPSTQLALAALENWVRPGDTVVDIGTGSGILSIAALRLGAARVLGVDTDETALYVARENFSLNALEPLLVAGSADNISDRIADITAANISGSVLLSILEHILRITRTGGRVILTGFPEPELPVFQQLFPIAEVSSLAVWRCITAELS